MNLSQGQRKRLALVTAMLEDRPFYVFDEWAADQDPQYKEVFYGELLPELRARGKGVIVVTHDDRYFHVGDRVLKLDEGKLVDASTWDHRVASPTEPGRCSSRSPALGVKKASFVMRYCDYGRSADSLHHLDPLSSVSRARTVHVWFCDLSRHERRTCGPGRLLSTDEQNRAARFAFDRDRQRFILSHGLLRRDSVPLCGGSGRGGFNLKREFMANRLYCVGILSRQAIEFSLSHSGQYALVAVANGRAVGVDIEVCRPDVDALTLAQRFFAPGESQRIAQAHGDERQRMFYRYWTGKEAYLKGRGVGTVPRVGPVRIAVR